MALVGRRSRRRQPRLLVVGVVLTVLVLGINALASRGDDGAENRLDQMAWIDTVRPVIDRSTQQGMDLVDLRENGIELGRAAILRRLERVERDAAAGLRTVERSEPPSGLRTAHSLLSAALAVRARAAGEARAAFDAVLGTGPTDGAVQQLVDVGLDMAAADRTYRVFRDTLPAPESASQPPVPESVWVADLAPWTREELDVFVAALRASEKSAPVHDLSVVLVTTEPAAVGREGDSLVLPPTRTLRLDIVVANAGNEAEERVTVVATLTGPAGEVDTARDFVDLQPGGRKALTLGGLRTVTGASSLVVRIEPVEGETDVADNERILPLVVR